MARTKQPASAPMYGTPGNIRPADADRFITTYEEFYGKPFPKSPETVAHPDGADTVQSSASNLKEMGSKAASENSQVNNSAAVDADESVMSDKENATPKDVAVAVNDETPAVDADESVMSDKENATPKDVAVALNDEAPAVVDAGGATTSDKENSKPMVVAIAPSASANHVNTHEAVHSKDENEQPKKPAGKKTSRKLTIKIPTAIFNATSPSTTTVSNKTGLNSSAVKTVTQPTSPASPRSPLKRSAGEFEKDEAELTDSDVDMIPTKKPKKVVKKATRPTKKAKTMAAMSSNEASGVHHFGDQDGDVEMSHEEGANNDTSNDANGNTEQQLFLVQPEMKRMKRIVDPSKSKDAGLIRQATKAGPEYYDSDADDLPGEVKSVKHPEWYRNVKWGSTATDYKNFEESEPHVQFVPGRWEHQPDGTVRDQKHKLLVKFVDNNGKQKIFTNPPPKDWSHQEALTALNKRIAQQWRRGTNYRFRQVVCAYVREERVWISNNLNADAKPAGGWKAFVEAFNAAFHDKMLSGQNDPRPKRSQSSLTKEIERFAAEYKAGRIPVPTRNQDKRAVGKAKRQAKKA